MTDTKHKQRTLKGFVRDMIIDGRTKQQIRTVARTTRWAGQMDELNRLLESDKAKRLWQNRKQLAAARVERIRQHSQNSRTHAAKLRKEMKMKDQRAMMLNVLDKLNKLTKAEKAVPKKLSREDATALLDSYLEHPDAGKICLSADEKKMLDDMGYEVNAPAKAAKKTAKKTAKKAPDATAKKASVPAKAAKKTAKKTAKKAPDATAKKASVPAKAATPKDKWESRIGSQSAQINEFIMRKKTTTRKDITEATGLSVGRVWSHLVGLAKKGVISHENGVITNLSKK